VNAVDRARTAYTNLSSAAKTPRSVEHDAFLRVTRQLQNASREGATFPELVAALHENRRLWNVIAADVADPANQLPDDLRARLFYLAEFVTHHSRKVADRTASIDALVEVNTAIMRGLRHQSEAA